MRNLEIYSDLSGSKDPTPTRVTILYENLECGKQARRTYGYLVDSLREVCQFTVQFWKFNLLEDSRLRSIAAQDAAEADIVIVSSRGHLELPTSVKLWFRLWFKAKDHPIGLVALFLDPDRANVVRKYLAKLAKQGAVELFVQPSRASGKDKSLTPLGFAALTNHAQLKPANG